MNISRNNLRVGEPVIPTTPYIDKFAKAAATGIMASIARLILLQKDTISPSTAVGSAIDVLEV